MVNSPNIVLVTKTFLGWLVEETTLEAVWMKNFLLPHLGCLGRFSIE